MPPTWLNHLGVPRPLYATVDRRAVGGSRMGEFEGGLRFVERIRAYEPGRRLSLQVEPDARALAADDMLAHAFDSGLVRLDDVSYRLRPTRDGVEVTLSCSYTLRTNASAYGHLWSRAMLGSFEQALLAALKTRFEGAARKDPVPVAKGR